LNVKESILEAGIALLESKGIAALTQPQVAAAAGVKQSHLTYYFPTRTDLLLAIAECWVTRAMAGLSARLGEKPEFATLAETLAETMIDGEPSRAIIGLIVAADAEPRIRDTLRALDDVIRSHFKCILAGAGLPASDDDALLLHATAVGLAVMHQSRLNAGSAAEFRVGINALLRYLASPPSRVGKIRARPAE
jgi:AcrR family transcriptional regulator